MRRLGLLLGVAGAALAVAGMTLAEQSQAVIGVLLLVAAAVVAVSAGIARYLKVLIGAFAMQMVLGAALVELRAFGLLPWSLPATDSLVTTFATGLLFIALARALWAIPIGRRCFLMADDHFNSSAPVTWRVGGRVLGFGPERRLAATLLVVLILLMQMRILWQVKISYASTAMANGLQQHDPAAFWRAILVEMPLYLTPYIVVVTGQFLVGGTLSMRWRRSMTRRYSSLWLTDHAHYRLSVDSIHADNPDQRIQEDVSRFIDGDGGTGLQNFTLDVLQSMGSFITYALILWKSSVEIDVPGVGVVPGLLLWMTVLYTVLSTLATVAAGYGLSALIFAKQHFEANFRFGLSRIREYSGEIALLGGEAKERAELEARFSSIMRNFFALLRKRALLSFVHHLLNGISPYIPYLILGALFFSERMSFATLSLSVIAFSQVQGCLTYFISAYAALADFRASVDRLSSFEKAIGSTHKPSDADAIRQRGTGGFILEGVVYSLPNGSPVCAPLDLHLRPGEHCMLTGPSGCGKSTLLKVLGGVWPHWTGRIAAPPRDVMVVPQKVYMPLGDLASAICYPSPRDAVDRTLLEGALRDVGLSALIAELDVSDSWSQRLSGGELQRLGVARALVAAPDWLLLDEATSALDPKAEDELYRLLKEKLPGTTLVSIAHRPALLRHHDRLLEASRNADGLIELADREKPEQAKPPELAAVP